MTEAVTVSNFIQLLSLHWSIWMAMDRHTHAHTHTHTHTHTHANTHTHMQTHTHTHTLLDLMYVNFFNVYYFEQRLFIILKTKRK